jgi:hypothetical protein
MATYLDNEFRQIFRNLFFPERVRNLDVNGWLKYCKQSGATTVWMDMKAQAYAYYNTRLIPKDPVLGKRDLVAEFRQAAKRHGLKCCLYIAPQEIESMVATTADWQQRDNDGAITRQKADPLRKTSFCWNAPGFRDHFAKMIGEVASKYHPHGFYIDGIVVTHTACYCKACKVQYKQATGRSIPLQPRWQTPEWQDYLRWRYRGIGEAARLIHEAVHRVDPRISVVFNSCYPWCGWYSGQTALPAQWLDYVGTEIDLTSGARVANDFSLAEQLAWVIGATRMLKGGQRSHMYVYFTPKTRRAEAATAYDTILAAGALPCAQEHVSFMKDLFDRTRRVEPYLVDMIPAATTALHVSTLARDAYYQTPVLPKSDPNADIFVDRPFFDEMRGALKGLLHNHIPTELVHLEDGLENSDLSGFTTLILPNSVCLAPALVGRLQDWVQNGGNLIATLETGLRDATGVRTGTELLWPRSGLTFKDEIQTAKGWDVKFDSRNALLELEDDVPAVPNQYLVFPDGTKPWIGEDLRLGRRYDGVEVREGLQFADVPSCQIPAKAVEVAADETWTVKASMRFCRTKALGWQDCPAVSVRRWGRGKIAYLNFQIGTLISSTGHEWWTHLLGKVVRELSGPGPVSVKAPTCVKVFAWKQPGKRRYLVHVINELSTSGVKDLQRVDRVPVTATVRIAWPEVTGVRQAVGTAKASVKRSRRGFTVKLENLADRTILVCKY